MLLSLSYNLLQVLLSLVLCTKTLAVTSLLCSQPLQLQLHQHIASSTSHFQALKEDMANFQKFY